MKDIKFTKEELKIIASYKTIIESIIVNQSCSNLTITFRQDMQKLGDKLGLNICATCSSGIFNLVSRIYRKYTQQINEKN